MNEGIKGLGDGDLQSVSAAIESCRRPARARKKLATVVENALLRLDCDQLSCLAVSWWRSPKET
jgi:hypothetical protein